MTLSENPRYDVLIKVSEYTSLDLYCPLNNAEKFSNYVSFAIRPTLPAIHDNCKSVGSATNGLRFDASPAVSDGHG